MKVLYFVPHQLWPLTTGARIRDFYLARELARVHEVTIVELLHPRDQLNVIAPEAGFRRIITLIRPATYTLPKLVRGFLGPVPINALNCYSRTASDALGRLLDEATFDVVHIAGSPLAGYLPEFQKRNFNPAVILDWHNIESSLMSRYACRAPTPLHRLYARRTAALLEGLESRLLAACTAHTAVSEQDRSALLGRRPQARVYCIPNGTDVEWFASVFRDNMSEPDAVAGTPRRRVLFVGSMDYFANVEAALWFCKFIWPELERRHPSLDLLIVGRNPTRALRSLASSRIIVTGAVEDVRPYYRHAAAALAPLRVGAGSRLKILEAMAAGVPVVSTALGAEGIEADPGKHYLLANSEKEMISALDDLLNSRTAGRVLAEAAYRLVRERYDWSVVGRSLLEVYRQVCPPGRQCEKAKPV